MTAEVRSVESVRILGVAACDFLRFFLMQLSANAVVHELSLYQASKWIMPLHPTLDVNATACYLPSVLMLCGGPVAECADQIVIAAELAIGNDGAVEGIYGSKLFCTIERVYLNAQYSGAAALVIHSEPYMG